MTDSFGWHSTTDEVLEGIERHLTRYILDFPRPPEGPLGNRALQVKWERFLAERYECVAWDGERWHLWKRRDTGRLS